MIDANEPSNGPSGLRPVLPSGRRRVDVTALVASRICHDLASPLGAIGNGLELLTLTGFDGSPEMDLISESIADANARIRYFRIAYGTAGDDQSIGRAEITGTLSAAARGGRVSYDWEPSGDQPRTEVQAVFLLLQCLETAMAHGGHIVVARAGADWVVEGTGPRMKVDEAMWTGLQSVRSRSPQTASHVQFALLPDALVRIGRPLALKLSAERISARF